LDEAKAAFARALAEGSQIEAADLTAMALYGLSQVAQAEGDEQIASQLGEESLAVLEPTQHYKVLALKQWVETLRKSQQN
jgi:hypothetical protein